LHWINDAWLAICPIIRAAGDEVRAMVDLPHL
jgi:hypothetical protein